MAAYISIKEMLSVATKRGGRVLFIGDKLFIVVGIFNKLKKKKARSPQLKEVRTFRKNPSREEGLPIRLYRKLPSSGKLQMEGTEVYGYIKRG